MTINPRDIETAALRAQLAGALSELASLRDSFAALVEQGARTNDRLAELTAVLLRRQRPLPKPPAPPAPAELNDAQRAAYDERPKPPAPTPRAPKTAKPRKPTGR